jgi:hypothetical protein
MNNNIILLTTGTTLVLLSASSLLPPTDAFSAPRPVPLSPVGGDPRRCRIRPRSRATGVAASNDDAATTTATTKTLTAAAAINPLLANLSSVGSSVPSHSIRDATSTALLSRKRTQSPDRDDFVAATPPDDDDAQCVEAGLVEYCAAENEPLIPPLSFMEGVLSTYVGPRFVLGLVAVLYGTNFPLGAIMNDNLPASAATSSRMVLASLVLSPFLSRLRPTLRRQVLLGGAFVSLGYICQSVALVDTSPALVSFLGSATVLVCPVLQWLVDGRPMGIKDAPQTWLVRFPPPSFFGGGVRFRPFSRHCLLLSRAHELYRDIIAQAAALCLSGVAALELFDSSTNTFSLALLSKLGTGDALSLLQAVGFGTGVVSR